ncbi:hypothetical protein CP556_25070 [Natrinema sp. CBA1119]|nr:hypothetical protein CP556_25070 [Natrinema sp. CBA1119]
MYIDEEDVDVSISGDEYTASVSDDSSFAEAGEEAFDLAGSGDIIGGIQKVVTNVLGRSYSGTIEDAVGVDVDTSDIEIDRSSDKIQLTEDFRRQYAASELDQSTSVDIAPRDIQIRDGVARPTDTIQQQIAAEDITERTGITATPDDILVNSESNKVRPTESLQEEIITHRVSADSDIGQDDIADIEFEGDQAQVKFTEEYREQQAAEQFAGELDVSPEAIEADVTGDGFDFEVVSGYEKEFLPTEEVKDPDQIEGRRRMAASNSAAPSDFEADERYVTGPYEIDDYDVSIDDRVVERTVSPEAQKRVVLDQIAEEQGVDESQIELERDGDEFNYKIDEERDTWVGRGLEDASESWQSGVDKITGEVEASPTRIGVNLGTGQVEERTGQKQFTTNVIEGAGNTLNPPGNVLAAADTAVWANEQYEEIGQARSEAGAEFKELDIDDITTNPVESTALLTEAVSPLPPQHTAEELEAGGSAAVDIAKASSQAFKADPRGSTERFVGAGAVGYLLPTAAVRGARAFRNRVPDIDSPRSFAADNRAQTQITIQRQRERSGDPDGNLVEQAEARLPPREEFRSRAEYDRELDQMVGRIAEEEGSPYADPTATRAEDRLPPREEFPSEDAYQRELEQMREQVRIEEGELNDASLFSGQQTATAAAMGGNYGRFEAEAVAGMNPSSGGEVDMVFVDPSGGGEEEAVAGVVPSVDETLDFGLADPSPGWEEEMLAQADADAEALTDFAAVADSEVEETADIAVDTTVDRGDEALGETESEALGETTVSQDIEALGEGTVADMSLAADTLQLEQIIQKRSLRPRLRLPNPGTGSNVSGIDFDILYEQERIVRQLPEPGILDFDEGSEASDDLDEAIDEATDITDSDPDVEIVGDDDEYMVVDDTTTFESVGGDDGYGFVEDLSESETEDVDDQLQKMGGDRGGSGKPSASISTTQVATVSELEGLEGLKDADSLGDLGEIETNSRSSRRGGSRDKETFADPLDDSSSAESALEDLDKDLDRQIAAAQSTVDSVSTEPNTSTRVSDFDDLDSIAGLEETFDPIDIDAGVSPESGATGSIDTDDEFDDFSDVDEMMDDIGREIDQLF